MIRRDLIKLAGTLSTERRARLAETFSKRLAALKADAVRRNILGAGFYLRPVEEVCAQHVVDLADAYLAVASEVLDAANVYLTEDLRAELQGELLLQLRQDAGAALQSLQKAASGSSYHSQGLIDEALRRAETNAAAQLTLYSLRSRSRQLPLDDLLQRARYAGVRELWQRANDSRTRGDLPNAVKDAVAALEAATHLILQDTGLTLGDSVKELRKRRVLSPQILSAIEKLWGFANEASGVRHGTPDGVVLDEREAQFALESCTAVMRLLLSVDSAA